MKIKILSTKKTKDICEEGNVFILNHLGEGPECEHCRQLPPFTALVSDGNTWWCLDCFGSMDSEISLADLDAIEKECLEREKKYIAKRYKQLFG
jgi:hypothetical protein